MRSWQSVSTTRTRTPVVPSATRSDSWETSSKSLPLSKSQHVGRNASPQETYSANGSRIFAVTALSVQLLLVGLNLWIGIQFYLWVRWAESGGRSLEVSRPAGVEGWLPIEGLMQLKYFLLTGLAPRVHVAGFFLFTSFLLISILFRKSFCSWRCPVATLSEYLWKLGRSTFRRNFHLPRRLDIGLRSLKYLLLGFFFYAV